MIPEGLKAVLVAFISAVIHSPPLPLPFAWFLFFFLSLSTLVLVKRYCKFCYNSYKNLTSAASKDITIAHMHTFTLAHTWCASNVKNSRSLQISCFCFACLLLLHPLPCSQLRWKTVRGDFVINRLHLSKTLAWAGLCMLIWTWFEYFFFQVVAPLKVAARATGGGTMLHI